MLQKLYRIFGDKIWRPNFYGYELLYAERVTEMNSAILSATLCATLWMHVTLIERWDDRIRSSCWLVSSQDSVGVTRIHDLHAQKIAGVSSFKLLPIVSLDTAPFRNKEWSSDVSEFVSLWLSYTICYVDSMFLCFRGHHCIHMILKSAGVSSLNNGALNNCAVKLVS